MEGNGSRLIESVELINFMYNNIYELMSMHVLQLATIPFKGIILAHWWCPLTSLSRILIQTQWFLWQLSTLQIPNLILQACEFAHKRIALKNMQFNFTNKANYNGYSTR